MNSFRAAVTATILSAVTLLVTANPVFVVPLLVMGFVSGWTGMEQRYGGEVN